MEKTLLLDFLLFLTTISHACGGWIVIQRRSRGDVDFYRDWAAYRDGFGSLDGDFWLGNENIHTITSPGQCKLSVNLVYKGNPWQVQYSEFSVGDESTNYTLRVDGYTGPKYFDSLAYNDGAPFSTYDRDNDKAPGENCAEDNHGAWWYKHCTEVNLNGKWMENSDKGVVWFAWSSYTSMTFSELKVQCAG